MLPWQLVKSLFLYVYPSLQSHMKLPLDGNNKIDESNRFKFVLRTVNEPKDTKRSTESGAKRALNALDGKI